MLSVANIRTAVKNGNFNRLSSLEFVPKDKSPDPWMNNGRFGVVFKMQHSPTNEYYALKVIKENNIQKKQRFREILQYIENYPSPYWTGYSLWSKELNVSTIGGTEAADVISMEWIEGDTLGDYFKKLCETNNQKALAQLAYTFDMFALWLLQNPFAHGDLKQDNLLVRPNGNLVLVDYDGIFLPQFEGQYAYEIGTSDYQHPQRDHTHFGSYIDDFSILVISLSLYAAAEQPQLYAQYCQGDNLLLCSDDFDTQTPSPLITTLKQSLQPAIRQRVALLDNALALTPQSIIALPQCLQNTQNYTILLKHIEKQAISPFVTDAEAQRWYDALQPNLSLAIIINVYIKETGKTTEQVKQLIEFDTTINDIIQQLLPLKVPQALITALNLNKLSYFFNPNDESLTDISPLSKLTNLQTLDLSGCINITDINPLSNLTNLQKLMLGGSYMEFNTGLIDINPLSKLTNLQTLYLSMCENITDITPLSKLTNLQTLGISGENLTDISPLSKLTNLQTLNISGKNLTDISPLNKLTKLQTLYLMSCKNLTDISPLSRLTNLKKLILRVRFMSFNEKLIDIKPLSKLVNLQKLDLMECKNLTDISPLKTLTNLQNLDLSLCENLTDISPLKTLTNLQTLKLRKCYNIPSSAVEELQKQLPACEIMRY